jgi:hypothetical protein
VGSPGCEIGIGPRTVIFLEDPIWDRVFYGENDDYGIYKVHRVRYSRSDDEFETYTPGVMNHCTGMDGWYSCISWEYQEYLYSTLPISVTWSDSVGRSVFAWVDQKRTDEYPDRQIRISVGYIEHWLLSWSPTIDAKSDVGVGVVCRSRSITGLPYECFVAYTGYEDPYARVRIKRFNIALVPGYTYYVAEESGYTYLPYDGAKTRSSITAWWHDGYFWVAIRSIWYGQDILVYKSSDMINWTFEGRYGYSVVGPTAVSYWHGNNVLVYFR